MRVLYFEGDRGHQFRILRGVKNRFGATDEIGVFAMTEQGLAEVPNPSALFLAERRGNIAGPRCSRGWRGTRPVLVEVQALLSPNAGGSPRRSVIGWDGGRLAMMLAVLDSRAGLRLSAHDVYLNVAGGLRVQEPAADLAVAAALASAATETPTDAGSVYFGEVGLSGEIRQVAQADARLKEAAKLGFSGACLPRRVAQGGAKVVVVLGVAVAGDGTFGGVGGGVYGQGVRENRRIYSSKQEAIQYDSLVQQNGRVSASAPFCCFQQIGMRPFALSFTGNHPTYMSSFIRPSRRRRTTDEWFRFPSRQPQPPRESDQTLQLGLAYRQPTLLAHDPANRRWLFGCRTRLHFVPRHSRRSWRKWAAVEDADLWRIMPCHTSFGRRLLRRMKHRPLQNKWG